MITLASFHHHVADAFEILFVEGSVEIRKATARSVPTAFLIG